MDDSSHGVIDIRAENSRPRLDRTDPSSRRPRQVRRWAIARRPGWEPIKGVVEHTAGRQTERPAAARRSSRTGGSPPRLSSWAEPCGLSERRVERYCER